MQDQSLKIGELAGATIVFDLDGTLIDTAPDLLRALNAVLAQEGLTSAPAAAMRTLVGHGARALIEKGAGLQRIHFPAAKLDQLTEDFVRIYSADIAAESRPFPGLEEALDALEAAGATLAVCTNKRTDLSVQLLEALGLAQRFAAICGPEAAAHKKPHPDHFRATVAAAGGTLRRSLMVGDSMPDVASAKSAGAPAIVVRFGYSSDPVEKLGADAILDGYAALPSLVGALLRPRK